MSPIVTATEYVTLPAGEYQARVKDVQTSAAQHGPIVKIYFEILGDPDYAGEVVSGLASLTFSPKSKLRGWVEGLTGRTFEPGDPFDTDELKGLACRITLIEHETPDGTFNRIIAVMPPERPRPPRRQAPASLPQRRTLNLPNQIPTTAGQTMRRVNTGNDPDEGVVDEADAGEPEELELHPEPPRSAIPPRRQPPAPPATQPPRRRPQNQTAAPETADDLFPPEEDAVPF